MTNLISLQPLNMSSKTVFPIDIVWGNGEPDENPWTTTYAWNDDYVANYNNDVFDVKVTSESFHIERTWRHQLKKWVEPVASDYGELRLLRDMNVAVRWKKKQDERKADGQVFQYFCMPNVARKFDENFTS